MINMTSDIDSLLDPLMMNALLEWMAKNRHENILLAVPSNKDDPFVKFLNDMSKEWFYRKEDTAPCLVSLFLRQMLETMRTMPSDERTSIINSIRKHTLINPVGVRVRGKNEYNKDVSFVDGSKYLRRR